MGEHSRHQEETHDEVPDQNVEESGVLSPDEMKAGGESERGSYEPAERTRYDGAGNPIEQSIGSEPGGS